MKTISRTISVLVLVNLLTAGSALAEKVPEEEPAEIIPETVELHVPPEPPRLDRRRVIRPVQRRRGQLSELAGSLYGWTSPRQELQAKIAQFVAAETALVIPTPETMEKTPDFIKTTVKDLNIMCRIFDKELKLSDQLPDLYNYVFFSDSFEDYFVDHRGFFGGESRKTKGIYLDGYGALFLIEVDFPLSAAPQAEEQEKQIEEPDDPIWKQAEQELYSPEKLKKKKEADSTKKYDAEKVEDLKRELIKALKHSTNIRSLKADESIIISVKGHHSAENPTKVLIIRANKPDLDAFAKGELDFEEFGQKVQMLMY